MKNITTKTARRRGLGVKAGIAAFAIAGLGLAAAGQASADSNDACNVSSNPYAYADDFMGFCGADKPTSKKATATKGIKAFGSTDVCDITSNPYAWAELGAHCM